MPLQAQLAGLQPGDQLLAINGTAMDSSIDLDVVKTLVKQAVGRPLFVLLRPIDYNKVCMSFVVCKLCSVCLLLL